MRVGVMATNGGPHPSDKWAEETAGEIIAYVVIEDAPTDDDAAREMKRAARRSRMRLEADIVDAVEGHHHDNIVRERSRLEKHGNARLNAAYDDDGVELAVQAVVDCAQKYPIYAAAFASDNGREIIRNAIRTHFATAAYIERSYHADRVLAAGEVDDDVKHFHARR